MKDSQNTVSHAQKAKALQRQELKAIRQSIAPDDRFSKSRQIADHCMQEIRRMHVHTIFIFVSFRDEVETHELIRQLLQDDFRVAVPYINPQTQTMIAVVLNDFADLAPGHFGVLEPKAPHTVLNPSEIELTLLPGLGFDQNGYRMGYGGGYYDAFLAQKEYAGRNIALAFEEQVVPCIVHDVKDHPVDAIMTECRTILCPHQARLR